MICEIFDEKEIDLYIMQRLVLEKDVFEQG